MKAIAELYAALEALADRERAQLAVWLPVFMGAGVLTYYALRWEPWMWSGAVVAAPAIALAAALPRWRCLLAPWAACAVGFGSAQLATARMPPIQADLPSRAAEVTGTVRAVEALPDGRRISIQPADVDGIRLPRAVRVRLQKKDEGLLATGDTVRIRALVRPPAMPSYPGGWDLQRDDFYNGLGASGYALGPAERLTQAVPSTPMRFVQWLRETIAARVIAVIPGAAGAVSVTLLTGASMAIPEPDHAAFRDSGLAHLLAVAGLHIGIVMGFALTLSRLGFALNERASLFWPAKKLSAVCALLAGAAYMVLTGMHVPIVRSFAMACLFTVAVLADRRPFSLRGLALAAVVLMLIAPQEVPGVSFQMSFSAVLALISGYEALRPWLRRLHGRSWHRRFLSHLVALALTSTLAGVASAPYGAYHFGHGQAYFVLSNMVAVPLTALWVMPAGLLGLFLMPLNLEFLALVPMGWGAQAVLWVAHATADLPAATFPVPHVPVWGLSVFSVGLAWLGIWRTRWRLLGIAAMAVGLAAPYFDRPADVLVSADGRLIAVRMNGAAYLQQAQGGSKFTRDAWAQYWAVAGFRPMEQPAVVRADGNSVDNADIVCDPGACLLRPFPNRPGVLLARGATHPRFCDKISVIVSAEPARGLCTRPWPKLVDRFTVWRDGSAAIWLEPGGARVITDRAERGDRPWVPPPPQPRKQAPPTLPPAIIDRVIVENAAADRAVTDRDGQPDPLPGVPVPDTSNGE